MNSELQALVMANARRLILRKRITSNARLYMELFGTGYGTARDCCRQLGLDPDTNETCYTQSLEFIQAATKEKGE